MKAFLDKNILNDIVGGRVPFCKKAPALYAMSKFGDIELWIAGKSYTDSFYVLCKYTDTHLLQQKFLNTLEILNVCSVGEDEIRAAAQKSWTDFEDCLIYVCAESVQADCILTRDKKGFSQGKIPTYNLPEFFDYVEAELGLVYDIVDF